MSWTPERQKKLKELWKKGYTASQIATMLGETTRNALIGKAHRLNLEARAVSKKVSTALIAKKENHVDFKQERLSRKARFKALLVDKNFEPERPIYNLEDLTDQTCRFPLGHPNGDPSFHFCGRTPFDKSVYCRLHLILCFQPKNAKDDDIIGPDEIPQFIEKKIIKSS